MTMEPVDSYYNDLIGTGSDSQPPISTNSTSSTNVHHTLVNCLLCLQLNVMTNQVTVRCSNWAEDVIMVTWNGNALSRVALANWTLHQPRTHLQHKSLQLPRSLQYQSLHKLLIQLPSGFSHVLTNTQNVTVFFQTVKTQNNEMPWSTTAWKLAIFVTIGSFVMIQLTALIWSTAARINLLLAHTVQVHVELVSSQE